jgi:hypothetical protein
VAAGHTRARQAPGEPEDSTLHRLAERLDEIDRRLRAADL